MPPAVGACTAGGVSELDDYCQLVLIQIALYLSMGFPAIFFAKRASCAVCAKHVSFVGIDPRAIDPTALRPENWHSVGRGALSIPVESHSMWRRLRVLELAGLICVVAGLVPLSGWNDARESEAGVFEVLLAAAAWLTCAVCLSSELARKVRFARWVLQAWCLAQLGLSIWQLAVMLNDKEDVPAGGDQPASWAKETSFVISASGAIAAITAIIALCLAPSLDEDIADALQQPLLSSRASQSISERPQEVSKGWYPEDHANVVSLLFFYWILPLLKKGNQTGKLEPADMPTPTACDRVEPIFQRFSEAWARELTKEEPSLWRAVHTLVSWRFYAQFIPTGFNLIGAIGTPLCMNKLLVLMESGDCSSGTDWDSGYVWAAGLFFCSIFQTLGCHHNWGLGIRNGTHIRMALMGACFQKMQRLSPSARLKYSVGEMTNVVSVDSARIADSFLCQWLHWAGWSAIIVVIVSLWELYKLISWSSIIGASMMALVGPLSKMVTSRIKDASQQVQECRDARAKLVAELLPAVKPIKFLRWEAWASGKMLELRADELEGQRRRQILNMVNWFCGQASPILISSATLLCFALTSDQPITAATGFTALAWLNALAFPIRMIPNTLTCIMDCMVSIERVRKLLLADEFDPSMKANSDELSDLSINASGVSVTWPTDGPSDPHLKGLSIEIPRGSFVLIVGPVGSGKTTLLSALISQNVCSGGTLKVNGSLTYVPAESWIQQMTVKHNVLFGSEMDEEHYHDTLAACCLEADMEQLAYGDETTIGDRGITLSGGQRSRVSLARAVYRNSDVVIVDDVLSAVDGHVGRNIFDEAFCRKLSGKTRILATHHTQYARRPEVDLIIALASDGSVAAVGSYNELLQTGFDAAAMGLQAEGDGEAVEDGDSDEVDDEAGEGAAKAKAVAKPKKQQKKKEGDEDEEDRNAGVIRLSTVMAYFTSFADGNSTVVFIIIFSVLYQVAQIMQNAWLSKWTAGGASCAGAGSAGEQSADSRNTQAVDASIYCVVGVSACIVGALRQWFMVKASLAASKGIHKGMADRLFCAEALFFDTNPVGRILNRFVKDLQTIDEQIAGLVSQFFDVLLTAAAVVTAAASGVPAVLVALVMLAPFYWWVGRIYRAGARDLKRIEAVTRSPIYSFFSEAASGAHVIQAFGDEKRFLDEFLAACEENSRSFMTYWTANQWISALFDLMGSGLVGASACAAVHAASTGQIAAHTAGFALTYSLQLPQQLYWLVRNFADLEVNFVSVERCNDYAKLTNEPEGSVDPPHAWPSQGSLVMERVNLRYRPHLPLALRDLSIEIPGRSKVALVGRTGSGKTSLQSALSCLYPLEGNGTIKVDGIDLSTLKLSAVRRGVCAVPQDPVLFEGAHPPTPTRAFLPYVLPCAPPSGIALRSIGSAVPLCLNLVVRLLCWSRNYPQQSLRGDRCQRCRSAPSEHREALAVCQQHKL